MTVIVTGGAGFIGSALVRHLLEERGGTVVNVDKLTYAGSLETLAPLAGRPDHCFVEADVGDLAAMRALMAAHRPAAIVNLAAESHVDRSIDAPAAFIDTNVRGTFALLEAAREHFETLAGEARDDFRFVHVSTDEVYGSLPASGAFDETSPYAPRSPYSATKAASDHLVRAWHHTYGLPTIVTNCSNNYGPYQFPEKLIPLMVQKALAGEPMPVYGDGAQVRDWIFVDDHVRALARIMDAGRPGDTYLVGARAERRNIDVVKAIVALVDTLVPTGAPRAGLITHVADRPGHDTRYAIDNTKLTRELNWSPAESFESGLERTVRWILANPAFYDAIRARYDGGRLGLSQGAP